MGNPVLPEYNIYYNMIYLYNVVIINIFVEYIKIVFDSLKIIAIILKPKYPNYQNKINL